MVGLGVLAAAQYELAVVGNFELVAELARVEVQ